MILWPIRTDDAQGSIGAPGCDPPVVAHKWKFLEDDMEYTASPITTPWLMSAPGPLANRLATAQAACQTLATYVFLAVSSRQPRESGNRFGEHGFKGALINGHSRGRYLDHRFFWPILERAEALKAPIYLHPTQPPRPVIEASYGGFSQTVIDMLASGLGLAHRDRDSCYQAQRRLLYSQKNTQVVARRVASRCGHSPRNAGGAERGCDPLPVRCIRKLLLFRTPVTIQPSQVRPDSPRGGLIWVWKRL